jgi:hypothetical protein
LPSYVGTDSHLAWQYEYSNSSTNGGAAAPEFAPFKPSATPAATEEPEGTSAAESTPKPTEEPESTPKPTEPESTPEATPEPTNEEKPSATPAATEGEGESPSGTPASTDAYAAKTVTPGLRLFANEACKDFPLAAERVGDDCWRPASSAASAGLNVSFKVVCARSDAASPWYTVMYASSSCDSSAGPLASPAGTSATECRRAVSPDSSALPALSLLVDCSGTWAGQSEDVLVVGQAPSRPLPPDSRTVARANSSDAPADLAPAAATETPCCSVSPCSATALPCGWAAPVVIQPTVASVAQSASWSACPTSNGCCVDSASSTVLSHSEWSLASINPLGLPPCSNGATVISTPGVVWTEADASQPSTAATVTTTYTSGNSSGVVATSVSFPRRAKVGA